jgi:hypothetical protein
MENTHMQYFKTSQPVPGKGDAFIYYECDDNQTIQRYVTFLPATGETERNSDPLVKKLYRPEVLMKSDPDEFLKYWSAGESE